MKYFFKNKLWVCLAVTMFMANIMSAQFVVNLTTDSNPTIDGELRHEIIEANVAGGTITFNIPGGPPYNIVLRANTPLPAITKTVTIDGNTQNPFYTGLDPLINIIGSNFSILSDALTLEIGSDGSVIQNISIQSFIGNGIQVNSNHNNINHNVIHSFRSNGANNSRGLIAITGSYNSITNNFLGKDHTNTIFPESAKCFGVFITSGGYNFIGGSAALGNLISNTQSHGIEVASSNYNQISCNISYFSSTILAGINLVSGANQNYSAPTVTSYNSGTGILTGKADHASDIIEIFGSDHAGQANEYLMTVSANSIPIAGSSPVKYEWSANIGTRPWSFFNCTATQPNIVFPNVPNTSAFGSASNPSPCVSAPAITPVAPLCAGQTLNLNTPFVPGATYNWTGPNGFTSSLQNPVITNVSTAAAGSYSLILVMSDCSSTPSTVNVTVNPVPNASITPVGPLCAGQSLNLTTSSVADTYSWSGPDGFSSLLANPVITGITTADNGTYTLTVSSSGCTPSTTSLYIEINPTPAAPNIYPVSDVCEGSTLALSTPSPGSAVSYSWTGPNSFTSTLQNPTISNVTTAATGTYTLTVTQGTCVSPGSSVNVNIIPAYTSTPTINAAPVYCEGETIHLSTPAVSGADYSWSGPGGFTSNLQNPDILSATTGMSGTYTLTILTGSCASPQASFTITVNPIPSAPVINPVGTVCDGQNISLSTPTITGGTYQWSGPGAFSSSLQNPVITGATVAASGSYSLTVTSNGCTSPSTVLNINVIQSPAIAATTSLCEFQTIYLSTPSISGATYDWTGPAGFHSTLQNPSILNASPAMVGTYTLTVGSGACNTATTDIIVNPNPLGWVPVIVASGGTCGAYTFSYSAPSGATAIINAHWTFGDGTFASASGPSISHTYPANGTYVVTLSGDNTGVCSYVTTVTVSGLPSSDFTYIYNNPCDVSTGIYLNITSFDGSNTYSWNINGHLHSATGASTLMTADLIAGVNTISLNASNTLGCYSASSKVIGIGVPSTFNVYEPNTAYPNTICTGDLLTVYDVPSGGDVYHWKVEQTGLATPLYETPSTATEMMPTYIFNSPGTYIVTLTITNNYLDNLGNPVVCSTDHSETVTVNQLPNAVFAFSAASGSCNGAVDLITPVNPGMTSYSISYGDGVTHSGTTTYLPAHITHHYSANGIYTVSLTVNSGPCSSSYSHNVVINNNVTLALTSPSVFLCPGSSMLINSVITNVPSDAGTLHYAWTGPSSFSSGFSQINVSTGGTYYLTVTSDGTCALNVNSFITITGLATPTATVLGAPVLMSCSATTTTASLEIPTSLVKQGFCVNGVCTPAAPAATAPVTVTVPGLIAGDNYVTIANGKDHTCSGVVLVHVDQNLPSVTLNVTQPTSCSSSGSTGSAVITTPVPGSNIKWYTVANYPSAPFHTGASVSSLTPGNYVSEVTSGYCKVTNYFSIALPVINVSLLNNNPATCSGSDVQVGLNVSSSLSGFSYDWKKKDNSGIYQTIPGVCNCSNPSLFPGQYEVTVSSGDCSTVFYFEVKTYDPIAVTLNVVQPGCNIAGQVTALVSGGDGNYHYTWTLGSVITETTSPVLSLSGVTTATTVQVLVEDNSGCSATPPSVNITPPVGVTLAACSPAGSQASGAVNISDCNISVCVTGGTQPYNFEWYRIGDKESTIEHFFHFEAGILKDEHGNPVALPPSVTTQTELTTYLNSTANPNSDHDAATSFYPSWDFTGSTPVPVTTSVIEDGVLVNAPFTVTETIITHSSEFYITGYSGPSGQIADNGNFKTGEYVVKVTDANGCTYPLTVGHLEFAEPTGFKVGFVFTWGLNQKETPPVPEDQKVDEALAENMAEAANDLLDEADHCRNQQLQGLQSSLKNDCSNLANFRDAFSINYNVTEHHYTLYYYDRAGQLTKTVPPEGVELLDPTEIAGVNNYRKGLVPALPAYAAHRMTTTYQYNSLGQLISQNTPDGGTSNFIYDGKSRLRFSQNAKQLADGKFSYTKYDELGRITEVGESSLAGLSFGTTDPVLIAGNLTNANLETFPVSGNLQVTRTVYSDPAPSSVTYYGLPQRYLQNRISYVYIDNDPSVTGDEHYTYYSYDSHGNVEWLIQQDPELGKNYIAYEYDLVSGKVLKVKYNEHRMDRFFHKYSYDSENRLTKVETSRDGELWDADAGYKYYAHGPLQRNEIGEDHVQGLDNIYTITGWLKSINTPHLNVNDDPGSDNRSAAALNWETSQFARDRFGMILNYYKGDYTRSGNYLDNSITAAAPVNIGVNDLYTQANTSGVAPDLYNGNISSWTHSQLNPIDPTGSAPLVARADLFKYDVLNRIKQNVDLQQSGVTWGNIGSSADAYKTHYSYDANGNILTLNRYDQNGAPMDALAYNYDNGAGGTALNKNQLSEVNEGAGIAPVDGRGDLEGSHSYNYDPIGNLMHDVSQERLADAGGTYGVHTVTTDISWTVYGKIKQINKSIDFSGTPHLETISFSYDASGNRTKKQVWRNAGTTDATDDEFITTFYVRDAQGNIMSVYDKKLYPASSTDPAMYAYKLIEQPIYGSDRIGQNARELVLSTAATLPELVPPGDGINTISEYQNWITTTNKTSLLPGGNDNLCQCKIQKMTGAHYASVSTTAEFLGIAENGIAVAENLEGELQFYVALVKKYLGTADACLVYDKSGKLMKGTELIADVNTDSKPIISIIPGTNKYAVVTLNGSNLPVYHIVDLDATGYGTTPSTGAMIAGEVIAANLPMTNYSGTVPAHGWHFTAYEDHINHKSIVYNTRYTPNTGNPIEGKTELLAYEFSSDYNVQPQEHVLYELNGCGSTEKGELQISPQGDKLVWYQHDKNISAFDHRIGSIYTFNLTADKTNITGTVNYAAGTTQAGNYGEGRVEFMKNNNDLLYGERGVYKEANGYDKNTWKYEQIGNLNSLINPSTAFTPGNILDPTITYLFSEIRRGVDGNYYMPNMGSVDDKVHAYSGTAWNDDINLNSGLNEMASSLPTQVFKLYPDPSQVLSEYDRNIGNKEYELKDHLGNVRVVISDEKILVNANSDNQINSGDYFVPTILTFEDYYPFGMQMPGRSYVSGSGYRYGYQGQEKLNEMYGSGNAYSYEYRINDNRLGRFLSTDPLESKFAHNSPYAFSENRINDGTELEGLEFRPKNDAGESVAPDATNIESYEYEEKVAGFQTSDGKFHGEKITDIPGWSVRTDINPSMVWPNGTVSEGQVNYLDGSLEISKYYGLDGDGKPFTKSYLRAPWMNIAKSYMGLTEGNNPTIQGMIDMVNKDFASADGTKAIYSDKDPWCGVFVYNALKKSRSGVSITSNGWQTPALNTFYSNNWKEGTKLTKPAYGAIAVMPWGHVALVHHFDSQYIWILGGNQAPNGAKVRDGKEVNISRYAITKDMIFLLPKGYKKPPLD